MTTLREWLQRLVGALRWGRPDDDLQDELRAHVEFAAEAAARGGESPTDARRRARVRSGGTAQAMENLRDQRSLPWLTDLGRDVRYAGRVLAKNRGFTAAAVLSLGLGIGANTAIFSLIDAVLLRPLPVAAPHELYFLAHGEGDVPSTSSNYPLLEQYRSVDVFSGVTAYRRATFRVATTDSAVESVPGQHASGNYHAVIGVPIVLGRGLVSEPDLPVAEIDIAVISEAYWTRRFGRAPDVLGQTLVLNGQHVTIVGVTAAGFDGLSTGSPVDITVPLAMFVRDSPTFPNALDGFTSMPIVARLRPGVSAAQALVAANTLFQRFMENPDVRWARAQTPDAYSRARLLPAGSGEYGLRQQYREPLIALMGMAALVLIVASANVANLLLARSSARAREMAVRLSVGSGRGRLVRQLLTESAVLAVAGAVAGLLIASWATEAIVALFSSWRQPLVLDVAPGSRVFAFAATIALATGVAFGIVPALRATRIDLAPALKAGHSDMMPATGRALTSRALIVAQVALCMVIVVVAVLLGRSVHELKARAAFDRSNLVVFNLDASALQVSRTELESIYTGVLEGVAQLPGVTSASASTMTPLNTSGSFRGLHLPALPETPEARGVFANVVAGDYFRTLGVRTLRGRVFDNRDTYTSARVAMLNERTARHIFGDEDPIGRTVAWIRTPDRPLQVIGIVADVSQTSLRDDTPRMVYTPLSQEEELERRVQVTVRTMADSAIVVGPARDIARGLSPDVVITGVRTMDEQIDGSLTRERSLSWISTAFATLASVLACVGLYGVMSYQVTRRTRELGIRLALGASARSIFGSVIRETVSLALLGIAIGIGGALAGAQAISAFLYGVAPTDPLTLACVSVGLTSTALAAGYFPARRAARINPLRAIRME